MSILELLSPPPALAPLERVIMPDDVGGYVAWQMLVQHGALVQLFDGAALSAQVTPTKELRAEALGLVIPDTRLNENPLVVAGLAAAWVWLGGDFPAGIDVIYDRWHGEAPSGARVRASQFTAAEVAQVNGVWVTNYERTIRDIAVWDAPERVLPIISNLVSLGANLRKAGAMLERPARLMNRPAARDLIRQANEQLSI